MTLRSTLSAIANRGLSRMRANLTPQTSPDDVRTLIRRLSPQETDRTLIRLGPVGDGGYLVPDDLIGIETCFSPGVSSVSGFELDCANRGMKVYLADASVASPPDQHPAFHFSPKFLGASTSGNFVTLDQWVAEADIPSSGDLLLQMDIEGFEYEVLLSMTDALLARFRIIVVEFHGLENLWSRPWFQITSRAFEKLLKAHTCVHIHPNNSRGVFHLNGLSIPCDAQFTFLRTDRISAMKAATSFPHPLDGDCTSIPTPPLPSCWIGPGGEAPDAKGQ